MNYGFTAIGLQSLGSTSSSLLRRVRGREPEAWQRLVKLYGPIVFLWCRRSGLAGQDLADVVQETFAAVAGHIADFRKERLEDSFRGWLWTITRNKIRDYARRLKATPRARGGTTAQQAMAQVPDDIAPQPPESPQSLLGFVEHRAIEAIRVDFEDRTWQAFWQSAVEGRKAADIAHDLGMTKRAVRQATYRVLRRLREELEGLLD